MRPVETLVFCAVALTICSPWLWACDREDECSVEGIEWCHDNRPFECVADAETGLDWEEHGYLSAAPGMVCDKYGATCIEESRTSAYCAFTDESCSYAVSSLCVGTILADCTEHSLPMPVEDCADEGQICTSTTTTGLGAECAYE